MKRTHEHGRSFHATQPARHEGETNTWFTPQAIFELLDVHFDLDPCTQTYRPFDTAKRHICEDLGGDGLAEDWAGRVWLNPPYGKAIGKWLEKLARHGNGIALVFSRTETQWAQSYIKKADAVNFIARRVSFIRANGEKGGSAANGSMLLAWGEDNAQAIKQVPGIFGRLSDE